MPEVCERAARVYSELNHCVAEAGLTGLGMDIFLTQHLEKSGLLSPVQSRHLGRYCKRLLQRLTTEINRLVVNGLGAVYDPDYGDDKMCQCGHPYYRHFDTYEKMKPVGCKYCLPETCPNFRPVGA